MNVYTIGHSTRTADELSALLREHEIKLLADIRRYPGSKRYPHFASDAMAQWLPEQGIAYVHMPELGGRRKPSPDSPNTAWRNDQFRAYADYMATNEFRDAMDKLLSLAEKQRVAIMCAEAVPWRCHRSLIADALVARGVAACEIVSAKRLQPHRMTPFAVVEGARVTYPAEPASADGAGDDDALR